MLNRSASLAMSTGILKALPCKLDIKKHSPSILFISTSLAMSTSVLKALPGKLVALLCLSSWCLVIVVWLFLTMPRICLQLLMIILAFYFGDRIECTSPVSSIVNLTYHSRITIGTAYANSSKFRGIKPQMYSEDLL